MSPNETSLDEADRNALELYENRIRPLVETDENIGKIIVIDAATGEYEIDMDRNSLAMTKRLLAKHSTPLLYQFRIGCDAVDSF